MAPALIAGFGYDDLDGVADGGEASATLLRLAIGPPGEPEHEDRVRRALRTYCARDTEALVRLHGRLREVVAQGLG
jgi:hypothetical protein